MHCQSCCFLSSCRIFSCVVAPPPLDKRVYGLQCTCIEQFTYDQTKGIPQGGLGVHQSVAEDRLRCAIDEPTTYPRC